MNVVILTGRLTKDPEISYTSATQMAVASFTLACDNGKDKDGNKKDPDFIRCKAFGKTAETIEKYVGKGNLFSIRGKISTGSYKNKNGDTVYTTDVVVQEIQFLEYKNSRQETSTAEREPEQVNGFEAIDEDVPF